MVDAAMMEHSLDTNKNELRSTTLKNINESHVYGGKLYI